MALKDTWAVSETFTAAAANAEADAINNATDPDIYTSATGGVAGATPPAGFKGCWISAIGGGGAGGSGNSAGGTVARNGGGGGAGGNVLFERFVPASAFGATYTLVVPPVAQGGAKAGVGGTTAAGNAGANGGDVVFTTGSYDLECGGGGGGGGATSSVQGAAGATNNAKPGDSLGCPGGIGTQTTISPGTSGPALLSGTLIFSGAAGGGGGAGATSGGSNGATAGAGGQTLFGTGGVGAGRTTPNDAGSSPANPQGVPGGGGGGGVLAGSTGITFVESIQQGGDALGWGGGGGGGAGAVTGSGFGSGKGGNGGPAWASITWLM